LQENQGGTNLVTILERLDEPWTPVSSTLPVKQVSPMQHEMLVS
jgi:hypothetical protein